MLLNLLNKLCFVCKSDTGFGSPVFIVMVMHQLLSLCYVILQSRYDTSTELQIRGGLECNSKIIISQQKHMTPHRTVSSRQF